MKYNWIGRDEHGVGRERRPYEDFIMEQASRGCAGCEYFYWNEVVQPEARELIARLRSEGSNPMEAAVLLEVDRRLLGLVARRSRKASFD